MLSMRESKKQSTLISFRATITLSEVRFALNTYENFPWPTRRLIGMSNDTYEFLYSKTIDFFANEICDSVRIGTSSRSLSH